MMQVVPLRLFLVAPSALFTDHQPHGDGLLAFGYVRELAARGHELHVVAGQVDLREELPANVHLHELGAGRNRLPIGRLDFMRRLRSVYNRLARTAPFDLVHQLNPVDAGLSLALPSRTSPVVLGPYVPDWPGFRKPGGPLLRPVVLRLDRLVRAAQQRRATTVLLSTPAAATKLALRRVGRLHVRELPPGIDERAWHPGAGGSGQDVLFLANLEVRKGIHLALDAFALLAPELPAARLRVAGVGPELDEVRRRIDTGPARGRVELLGYVERDRVLATMQACDVYCLPSYGEPFGLTALEAMACAKPVVGTRAGGLGHLLSDEGGRAVPPGDAAALATALRELLADPGLLRAMGEHNRRVVEERYAWSRVVDRLEDLYAEAIRTSRSSVRAWRRRYS